MLLEVLGPDNTPLGWDAIFTFEAEHGITLPEPYRSFIATVADGSYIGPPDHGLLNLGAQPSDWGAERPKRHLSKTSPLTIQWIWEDGPLPASTRPVEDRT